MNTNFTIAHGTSISCSNPCLSAGMFGSQHRSTGEAKKAFTVSHDKIRNLATDYEV